MKKVLIVIVATILTSCGQIQTRTQTQVTEEDLTSKIIIKDFNAVKQGYGQNCVAEVQNTSNKKATFVSVEFTWHDKNGGLITSQKGNTKDIQPNTTGIVDSYFDAMPKGATFTARVNEVIFE